jgi:hypothetical protein
MYRRGESVPFAFVAESERFRSNVTPPPRPRRSTRETTGNVLLGLTVVAGLAGALLLGAPALDPAQHSHGNGRPAAVERR